MRHLYGLSNTHYEVVSEFRHGLRMKPPYIPVILTWLIRYLDISNGVSMIELMPEFNEYIQRRANLGYQLNDDKTTYRSSTSKAMIFRLRRFDLFTDAPQAFLERLAEVVQVRFLPRDEVLWRANDTANKTVFIELGMVKTGRMVRDAVFRTYALYGVGDVLGLQEPERHDMDALVLSQGVTGLFIPTRRLHEELLRYPQLMHAQMAVSRRSIEAGRDKIDIASAGEIAQRTAVLFHQLIMRYGSVLEDGSAQLSFRLTLGQIGEIVDAREETVSRVLSRWQRAKILIMDRHFCRFVSIQALEKVINQPGTRGVR